MLPRLRTYDTSGLIARGVLVLAPLLSFQAFPSRGGVSLAMLLPALVLAARFLTMPARRIPVWEFMLVGLLALSVLWGDEPDYSELRLHITVPVLVATILAANVVPPDVALHCLKIAVGLMVVSGAVLVIVSPAARVSPGYNGLAIHGQFPKNTFGALIAFALVLVVCSQIKTPALLVAALAPLLVLLVLIKSSTAYVVVFVLVGAILVLRQVFRQSRVRETSTLVWLALSGAAFAVIALLYSDSFFLNVLGKDPTLSSRTRIWAACWVEIKRAPFLGHGAFTFLDTDSRSPVTLRIWAKFTGYYLPPHPHNGLLDLWGQLGLVGVVVFACFIVFTIRSGVVGARLGDRTSLTALASVAFILLFGIAEPMYLGPWLVVTIVCAAAADPARVVGRRWVSVTGGHRGRSSAEATVAPKRARHRSTALAPPVGASSGSER